MQQVVTTPSSPLSSTEAPKKEALTEGHHMMHAEQIGRWSYSPHGVQSRLAGKLLQHYGISESEIPELESLFRQHGGNPNGRRRVSEVLERKYLQLARKQ